MSLMAYHKIIEVGLEFISRYVLKYLFNKKLDEKIEVSDSKLAMDYFSLINLLILFNAKASA